MGGKKKDSLDGARKFSLLYNTTGFSPSKLLGWDQAEEPEVPDPLKLGDSQTGTNVSTAIANALLGQVSQSGPYGSMSYNQTGSSTFTDPTTGRTYQIPKFTATTTLSPAGQAQQDQLDKAGLNLSKLAADQSGRIGDMLANPVNADGLPELTTDFSADRQKVEDTLMQRMSPYLAKSREDAERNLSNRGVKLGSTAYGTGIDTVNRAENDARLAAILGAGEEQSRLAALQSQARAQGMGERFALRNQPINEITALMSGGQVTQPQFSGIGGGAGIPTTDVAGLFQNQYQQQMARYQQQQAASQSNTGALAGLAAAFISDETMKKDIEPVGKVAGLGVGIYKYRMKSEPSTAPKRMGLMAREVEKVRPDAVVETTTGKKAVQYGKLGLSGLGAQNIRVA